MTIWAPVIAALGASFLTGGFTWGVSWWQERRRDRASTMLEKAAAYHELISRSLSFTARASALRNAMQARSGLKEGVDVTFRLRHPADPLELHDWIARDFEPINNAWSRIQLIGTAAAIDAATQLLDACADILGVATSPGRAHGKIASTVIGLAWTKDQQEELRAALKCVVEEREAFIKIARKELGAEEVILPLERVNQPDPSVDGTDQRAAASELVPHQATFARVTTRRSRWS